MHCSTCSSNGSGSKKACVGKLLLRLAVGVVFIYAGYFKFAHPEIFVPMFENLFGMAWLAKFVGAVEIITGIMMIIGFKTCLAGVLQIIILLVAIWTSHLGQGFAAVEFPGLVLVSVIAIVLMGPGHYSVARCMCKMCRSDAPAVVPPQV